MQGTENIASLYYCPLQLNATV